MAYWMILEDWWKVLKKFIMDEPSWDDSGDNYTANHAHNRILKKMQELEDENV